MMEITIKSEAKVICGNKDGLHRYFAWPSVAPLARWFCAAAMMRERAGARRR